MSCADLQNHFAGRPILDNADGIGHSLQRETVGYNRGRIELAGPNEPPHLLPGIVHPSAGYTVYGEPFEDHVPGEIDLGRAAGCSQHVHPSAGTDHGKGLGVAARMPTHFADDVGPIATGQLIDPAHDVFAGGVEDRVGSHLLRDIAPGGIQIAREHEGGTGGTRIPTAKQPIGPQPTTITTLPASSPPSRTVWTAFPIGSMIAPTSVGMPSRRMTLVAGIAMNSAKAPSRSTPIIEVLRRT